MAAPPPEVSPLFTFEKKDEFLSGNASIRLDLDASPSPAVALAIANNTAFPAGTIRLGNLNFKASAGGGDITLGGRDVGGAVSFSGSGGVRAGLGVYTSSADMFADLGGDANLLDGLTFNDTGVHRYVALYWGYDVKAAQKGSLALGTGASVKFGVDAASEGVFAFVRAYDAEPNARTAIADAVETWRLPRQISNANDLPPGTWAMAEVDGQFAATIGAQYGYNFNWVHKVGLQGLSGDIGLKIQAAVEVDLGFSASGKYFVIVGRDSLNAADEVLRVRLHRMSKRGFSFALNASTGVTGTTGRLSPSQVDQLIAGLLGTSAPQVVSDLKILRTIADPAVPLNKLAGDVLADYAEKELKDIVDVEQKFNEAKARIVKFLDLSDQLGDKASAILQDAVGKADPSFRTAIDALASASSAPAVKDIVVKEFAKVDFFCSPIGQFLESQASNTVVAMLASNADLSKLNDIAKKVQEVLDGKVITNLTKFIDNRLGLDKIRTLTLEQLDHRLKEKLAEFLAKPLDNAGLQQIRATMDEVVKKADKLYSEALKALNSTYSLELHASYQKTTTKDALIDVSFDFKANQKLAAAVRAAINGDFTDLLSKASDGVLLNSATMTHGVTRQTSVNFSMPYVSSSSGGMNEAIASLDVKAEDGGLFLYDLKAFDKQTQIRNNQNRWSSRLAVGLKLASLASGIRDSGDLGKLGKDMTASYGFRRAAARLGTAGLLHQLEPLQQTYFPDEFSVPGKPSLFEWVTDLDKVADTVENNGTGVIGNTLISLDIAVPGTVLAGWLNAPAKDKDPAYLKMSRAVQAALKRLIPYCYFQDVSRYGAANAAAAAVLVYSAIPALNEVHLDSDGTAVANSFPSYYWDVFDLGLVRAVVLRNPQTINNVASMAARIHRLMLSTDGLQGEAQYYEPSEVGKILNASLSGVGLADLKSLLFTEAEVLKLAVNAGKSMANFRRTESDQPAKALEELAEFGHDLTEAFNGKLTALFDPKEAPDLLRNFGTLVFLEASRQLQPALGEIEPTAVLDVSILRTKTDAGPVAFPPKNFPDNDPIPAATIALEQRILSIAQTL